MERIKQLIEHNYYMSQKLNQGKIICNLIIYFLAKHKSSEDLDSRTTQIKQAKSVTAMMTHYSIEWIEAWCEENGWTELFVERRNNYWAFPPGCVMPEPIPVHALRTIKAEKGLTFEERLWSMSAMVSTVVAVVSTFVLRCPMPLVFAFALNAVTVAQLELEDA